MYVIHEQNKKTNMDSKQAFETYPREETDKSNAQYIARVAKLAGLNERSLETYFYRHTEYKLNGSGPVIIGKTAFEATDFEQVKSYLLNTSIKAKEKNKIEVGQKIYLPELPVGLVLLADIHGGGKCDYQAIFDDVELVKTTKGVYCGVCGDITDNFIIGKLAAIQNKQPTTFAMEVKFAEWFIEEIKSKLLFWISGNHDNWTYKVSGIDIYKKYLENVNCLYDRHQVVFDLKYGKFSQRFFIRHKFKYKSIYNPTHGEETSWERIGIDFDIVIGSHYHQACLFREFVKADKKRLAILMGTYKIKDEYAEELGFAKSYGTGSCMLVYDRNYNRYQFDNLLQGIDFLKYLQT